MLWPDCQAQALSGGSGKDGDQLAGLGDSGFIPEKQLVGLEVGPCVGCALPVVTPGSAQILLSFSIPGKLRVSKALARGAVGCCTSHGRWRSFLLFYHNMVFLVSKLASDSICLPQVELEARTARHS